MSKDHQKKLLQQLVTACDQAQFASTVALAKAFLELSPDSVKARIDLAHALTHLHRFAEAESEYQAVLKTLDGENVDAVLGELGNLFRMQGDFAKAESFYRQQIESDADDATGWLFLGTLQLQQGDATAAEASLLKGLECPVGCMEDLHLALGDVRRCLGRYEDAAASYQETLNLVPGDAVAKKRLLDVRAASSV